MELIGQVRLEEVASQVLVRTGTARWQHISHYQRRAGVRRGTLHILHLFTIKHRFSMLFSSPQCHQKARGWVRSRAAPSWADQWTARFGGGSEASGRQGWLRVTQQVSGFFSLHSSSHLCPSRNLMPEPRFTPCPHVLIVLLFRFFVLHNFHFEGD